ncbi:MAG: CHAT domain-containing protein [Planctomycetota bacterium]
MNTPAEIARALLGGDAEETWARFRALSAEDGTKVVRELKALVDARMRSEPPAALADAEVLLRASEIAPGQRALGLRGYANALHYNARYKEALVAFEKAVELYEDAGDEVWAARTRRNLVDVFMYLGDTQSALACADLARAVFQERSSTADLAQLENNVGNVYTRLDEYPHARRHYESAREAFEALDHTIGVAITAFNLGVVEMNANDCAASERNFRIARAAFEEAGMDLHIADCDYSLAYLESRRGRFAEAIRGLEAARELYQTNGKPSGPPLCDLDLAEIFLRLDAQRNAVEYAERAAQGFLDLGLEYESARCGILAGLALVKLGANVDAVDRLERSAVAFRRLGNQASAAAVEIQRGAIEIDEGDAEKAVVRLRAAREQLAARHLRFLTDLAAVTLARAHLAQGEAPEARLLLEELLEESKDPAAFDLLLKADALALLSQARRATGDQTGATQSLRESVEHTERGYAEIPHSDIRVAFFRERHLAYVDLVWDLAEEGTEESRLEALKLLERSRARSLNESPAVLGGESEGFQQARERLDWLLSRHLDAELGPSAGEHDLRRNAPQSSEIRRAQDDLLRLARTSREGRPQGRTAFDEQTLAAARGEADVLLAYVTAPRGTRVLVADENGVHDQRLSIDGEEIERLRDRLWLHADKLRLGRDYLERHRDRLDRSIQAILGKLGDALVQPILQRIEGRGVVVVPFGALHDLPFHAFRVAGEPLARRAELGYALSAANLAHVRGLEPAGGDVLACGASAGTLENIDGELEDLARTFPNSVRRVDPEALIETLRSPRPRGGVLHLAAHSVYQHRRPVFSAVCLGERFLLAHDLLRMHLPFDLVVLSGCETGRRRRIPGEELYGLPRAILGAGARAVLGSLWAVDDADTRAFMQAFYAQLASGAPARRAIALAQRELLDAGLPTTTWAAFVLIGAPDVRHPAIQHAHL